MQFEQCKWAATTGWSPFPPGNLKSADLVFSFGSSEIMRQGGRVDELQAAYPNALIAGCSTAGEILGTRVSDDTLVVTAIHFDSSQVIGKQIALVDSKSSRNAGADLARQFDPEGLVGVFVLSEGMYVNGSELIEGLTSNLASHVSVTGGLSGDGTRFKETFVISNGKPVSCAVSAIGFYGDRLRIGHGSMGGWDSFGPERLVTRSSGNVLYELDGHSALDLYKRYLGKHASGLPATGLFFPLSMRNDEESTGLVRTILAVNETDHSVTFAGDIPEGWYARFMKANLDRLLNGASDAAFASSQRIDSQTPELAILISCVGRKMILKQRTEEEVEAAQDVLGASTVLTGFYSYGEFSPSLPTDKCALHNQTMTITTLVEV